MLLSSPLSRVPGVGPRLETSLQQLELFTVDDLIHHYPFRYDDFSHTASLAEVQIGETATIKGQIWSIKNAYTKNGKVLTRALLNDGTNSIELMWFNQSWLPKSLPVGATIQVSGKINRQRGRLEMLQPKWEKVAKTMVSEETPEAERLHTGRLVPVYSETFGLTSKWLRERMAEVLPAVIDQIEEPLPEAVRGEMMDLKTALQQVHFPDDVEKLQQAQARLAFDELFFIQLATLKTRQDWQDTQQIKPLAIDPAAKNDVIGQLPFTLTEAQLRVIDEVIADLLKDRPMNRLVQGEVGSGKTVVAAVIAYLVAKTGLQTLLMAPTEILAFQHFSTMERLLTPLGLTVGLYTGSKKFANFKSQKEIEHPDVVIGTHALISKYFQPREVGLVIVDEQQRFGVEQRAILRSHAATPHFLTMTATPIPRTVALTIYGDLDISIIDQMPANRKLVQTRYVPANKRDDAYQFIADKVKDGDQVYIVTPLIELSETMQSAKAATIEFERLQKEVWPKLKLGLLHGRLKPKEKEAVINSFKNHEIDILVSTSVVEVGVDVSNATIMVIEGAERFGLAGLHQLRGRVGRGSKESWCFLFSESDDDSAVRKLKNLESIHNGLKLAELDLQIRGGGEVFGTRQSGRFNLKLASFTDLPLIEKTRAAAQKILADSPKLDKYPQIRGKLAQLTAKVTPD